MKRKVGLLGAMCLVLVNLFGQKLADEKKFYSGSHNSVRFSISPPLKIEDMRTWESVSSPKISNDGNFAIYTIVNKPVGSQSMMIVSLTEKWEKLLPNCASYNARFTDNSKRLIFINSGDSLCFFNLMDTTSEYYPSINSFELSGGYLDEWIAYKKKCDSNELLLLNFKNRSLIQFTDVLNFRFVNGESTIVINSEDSDGNAKLIVTDLITKRSDTIYKGNSIKHLILDKHFFQLAFLLNKKVDSFSLHSLWYYNRSLRQAIQIVDEADLIDLKFDLKKIDRFSNDGRFIFMSLSELKIPVKVKDDSKVNVWSYGDPVLQSVQLKSSSLSFRAALNIKTNKIIQLEQEFERIQSDMPFKRVKEEYSVLIRREGVSRESNWNIKSRPAIYLVSNGNADKTQINSEVEIKSPYSYVLSSQEKFIVYYDPDKKNYFSYELASGVYRNITKNVKATWIRKGDMPTSPNYPAGILGFTENDKEVIIYDQNDIFQIDLTGKNKPIDLTNSYGKHSNQIFRVTIDHSDSIFKNGEKVIVSSLDRDDKNEGLYLVTIGKSSNPQLLTRQPKVLVGIAEDADILTEKPVKARDCDAYLIRQMSSNESGNYYYTRDLRRFTQLSFISPEKRYNWLKSELINWHSIDGTHLQGILYKPTNFDSTKKYPIVFYYYEKMSNGLNAFLAPRVTGGELNIPFFVSNEYLVFIPDIHYKLGFPGRSAYFSIVSAANYLSKFPWVNSSKMGLQGASFGGYQTNYVITQTNLFTAACSAAGVSNFASGYGSLVGDGTSRQYFYEQTQSRMKSSLWEAKDLYIENSPIYNLEKVHTPVLLVNNKEDLQVPFEQGVEFFTGLRRLGKRAWMLQYEGQGHALEGKAAEDLTIRMKQFFDHYLKDSAAPKWMLHGIPAKMKGIDNGLELIKEIDPKTGKWLTPKQDGLLNDEQKKKVEALKRRKSVTVRIKW